MESLSLNHGRCGDNMESLSLNHGRYGDNTESLSLNHGWYTLYGKEPHCESLSQHGKYTL